MSSIEIIGNLYSAFQNKDYDSFRALCSADLEWIQNKGFPKGGHHHGANAVIEKVFNQFEKDWEYFKFQIEDIFECEDGTQVAVIGSYIGDYKKTRKTLKAAAVHIYEIKNQKVKWFQQFTYTALIKTATEH